MTRPREFAERHREEPRHGRPAPLSALERAIASLATATSPEAVIEALSREARTALAADGAIIALLDDQAASLSVVHRIGDVDAVIARWTGAAPHGALALNEAAGTQEPMIRSELASVPLSAGGVAHGALCLTYRRPHRLTEEETALLEGLARAGARALERAQTHAAEARALGQLERANRRARALASVAGALAAANESADILKTVLGVGVPVVDAVAGSVMLVSADQACLNVAATVGYAAELVDRYRHIPIDAPLPSAAAIRERRAIYVHSRVEWATRYEMNDVTDSEPPDARWACVPLVAWGSPLGVLNITSRRPNPFDSDEQQFIGALADLGALALANFPPRW